MRVLTLGPEGSYSSVVAKAVSPEDANIIYTTSNLDTIDGLTGVDIAVLPVTNKYGGVVAGNMEKLTRDKYAGRTIRVLAWYPLRVRHVLASPSPKIKHIRKVYSHPQGLKQCAGKLSKINVEQIPTTSTSSKATSLELNEAVICSLEAAQEASLNILDDYFCPRDNVTDFVILTSQRRRDRHSLSQFDHNHERKLHNHKMIWLVHFTGEHLMGAIFELLGKYNLKMFFTEILPDGKGGIILPLVTSSLGNKRAEFLKEIRSLGCRVSIL